MAHVQRYRNQMEVKAPGTQSVKERELLYRLIVG